jgi:hypothetical protein
MMPLFVKSNKSRGLEGRRKTVSRVPFYLIFTISKVVRLSSFPFMNEDTDNVDVTGW